MSKLVLNDIGSLANEASAIQLLNDNFTLIEQAVDSTLTRTGATPNSMSADLDMNSNTIMNVADGVAASDVATVGQIRGLVEQVFAEEVGLSGPNGSDAIGFSQDSVAAVGRTVQDKLRDVVNVKDFGAIGDSITDDTAAINAAINYVNSTGGGKITFDRNKTYLISPNATGIILKSNVHLDLNGSTLVKATNGLSKYAILTVENVQNVVIENGTIIGDRDTHDFSSGGTHEFGIGVSIINSVNVALRRLKISKCTGDGIISGFALVQYYRDIQNARGEIAKGGIKTTDGTVDTSLTGYYSTIKLSITDVTQDVLHLWFRDWGRDANKASALVNVYYYDASNNFISYDTMSIWSVEKLKSELPSGAAKIAFSVPNWVWEVAATAKATLDGGRFGSDGVVIDQCEIYACRRQGMSVTGSKNVTMRDTYIHDISGTAPASAVDIEDNVNTNISFYNCVFANCTRTFLNASGLNVSLHGCVLSSDTNRETTLSSTTAETHFFGTRFVNCTASASGKTVVYGGSFTGGFITGAPKSDGTKWASGGTYATGANVVPVISNGFYYKATTGGTAGSTEPAWPTTIGGTVVDGGVTWECYGKSAAIRGAVMFNGTLFDGVTFNNLIPVLPEQFRFIDCVVKDSAFSGTPAISDPGGHLFKGVRFDFASTTAFSVRRTRYESCKFNIGRNVGLTIGEYATLVDCEITMASSSSARTLRFNQYSKVIGGEITDTATVACNIQLDNNVEVRNTKLNITRPISNVKDGLFINGANVKLDNVIVDHIGTIAANSAIVGIGSSGSGLSIRGCTFSTNSSGTKVVFTISGTPTYDLFNNLLVSCLEPTSSPGVNRLAGNVTV